jgi:L-rhamnose mutarotase
MNRYCFALDLKADPTLIAEYEAYHKQVWPEILQRIKESGVENLEIHRVSNRLFMIMEVGDGVSIDQKIAADAADPVVQEWEALMWKYQQALPISKPSEKWVRMEKIFQLDPDPASSNGAAQISEHTQGNESGPQ